jgi:hypothetical protein
MKLMPIVLLFLMLGCNRRIMSFEPDEMVKANYFIEMQKAYHNNVSRKSPYLSREWETVNGVDVRKEKLVVKYWIQGY